jgi:hypothetical protein
MAASTAPDNQTRLLCGLAAVVVLQGTSAVNGWDAAAEHLLKERCSFAT